MVHKPWSQGLINWGGSRDRWTSPLKKRKDLDEAAIWTNVNLKITPLKRKIIFKTIIFRFHVNLPGCSRLDFRAVVQPPNTVSRLLNAQASTPKHRCSERLPERHPRHQLGRAWETGFRGEKFPKKARETTKPREIDVILEIIVVDFLSVIGV